LQQEPQDFGRRGKNARFVRGIGRRFHIFVIDAAPDPAKRIGHAHAAQNFGIAATGFGQTAPFGLHLAGFLHRIAGKIIGKQRQDEQHHRPGDCKSAEPGVKQIDDKQIDRCPGHVEQGRDTLSGKETANALQVANRLNRVCLGARLDRQQHVFVQGKKTDIRIEAVTDTNQNPLPDEFQNAHEAIERNDKQNQGDERRDAAACKDPVIDLQHEQRPGQHQEIDDETEGSDAGEGRSRRRNDLCQRRQVLWSLLWLRRHQIFFPNPYFKSAPIPNPILGNSQKSRIGVSRSGHHRLGCSHQIFIVGVSEAQI